MTDTSNRRHGDLVGEKCGANQGRPVAKKAEPVRAKLCVVGPLYPALRAAQRLTFGSRFEAVEAALHLTCIAFVTTIAQRGMTQIGLHHQRNNSAKTPRKASCL